MAHLIEFGQFLGEIWLFGQGYRQLWLNEPYQVEPWYWYEVCGWNRIRGMVHSLVLGQFFYQRPCHSNMGHQMCLNGLFFRIDTKSVGQIGYDKGVNVMVKSTLIL